MVSSDVEASHGTNKTEKTRNFCETSPVAEDGEGSPSKRARTMQLGGNLEVPDDGQNWLKYGQKHIRGTQHQRNYYRCSMFKALGCPAKKTVDFRKTNASELKITDSHTHNHPCRSRISIDNVMANRVSMGTSKENHRIATVSVYNDVRNSQFLKESDTRNNLSMEKATENSVPMGKVTENSVEISNSRLNFDSHLHNQFFKRSRISIENAENLSSDINSSPLNGNPSTPKASNSLPKSCDSSLNGDSYSGKTTISQPKSEDSPLKINIFASEHGNHLNSNSSEDDSTEKLQKGEFFEQRKPGSSQSFGENFSWSSGTVNGGQQDESSPIVHPDTEEAISGSCSIGRKQTMAELRYWGQALQLGLAPP